ncbi:MAG: hypothetical protein M1839_004907 [Geoglossum umbratile]|nr:MAG: hypothetical protein M1839_004907 [Geoglossum umbratile]
MIIPERGRLTEMMISDKIISKPERKRAVTDLYSFITRDYTVLYRPGEEPIGGACLVNDCRREMEGIYKGRRAAHIHHCRRRECAKVLNYLQSDLIYCFQCFTWFVEEEWSVHCKQHLGSISSKGCGSINYCHTLIRPGYCPFCLGDETLSADERLQAWTRDTGLIAHLEKHVTEANWPSACPHPLCSLQLQDEMLFWYHLSDDHNLRRANKKGQKRRWEVIFSESNDNRQIKKKQKSMQPKKIDTRQLTMFTDPTISPMLTLPSIAESNTECPIVPDLTYTGSSSLDSTMSCLTGNSVSTRGYYDIDDFLSPLDFLEVNHDADSKEFTGITVVDLTEDKPLVYDDLVSQYTTLLPTCSSVEGASDDDNNEGVSDLVSGMPSLPSEIEVPSNIVDCNPAKLNQNAQIKLRKSGIRLCLNPPKPPTPKILLRVEQPEQLSSPKCRGSVKKNDKQVRNLAPIAKKSRRKHCI